MKGSIKTLSNEKLKSILVEIIEKSGFRCINKNRAEEFYRGRYNKTFNYIFKR